MVLDRSKANHVLYVDFQVFRTAQIRLTNFQSANSRERKKSSQIMLSTHNNNNNDKKKWNTARE